MTGDRTDTTAETRVEHEASLAARFVDAFTDAWARPTPDRLVSLLDPDVRLVAPLVPTTIGADAARREFERLFELLPDLRAEVHRWSARGNFVFIEFTLSATVGRRVVRWHAVDRFHIRDGLGTERISYFDPTPVVLAFLRHPSLWPKLIRSLARARGGSRAD